MYQINSCIKHNNEIINSTFKLDRNSALSSIRLLPRNWQQSLPVMKYSYSYISHINELKNLNKILNFHFKTRLLHWDVNNENLHGDWYERNTTDPDITPKMFQWIHAQEPDTQLFLNDYSAIPQPSITTVSDPIIMNRFWSLTEILAEAVSGWRSETTSVGEHLDSFSFLLWLKYIYRNFL